MKITATAEGVIAIASMDEASVSSFVPIDTPADVIFICSAEDANVNVLTITIIGMEIASAEETIVSSAKVMLTTPAVIVITSALEERVSSLSSTV